MKVFPREATALRYLPISHYGLIGNCRATALISKSASIDWCSFPETGDASVFASLLDCDKGGRFAIHPTNYKCSMQRYLDDSNVLETRFEGTHADGAKYVVSVLDFMPLEGDIKGRNGTHTQPSILRRVTSLEGRAEIEIEWSPRLDYSLHPTRIHRDGEVWVANVESQSMILLGLEKTTIGSNRFGDVLSSRFDLKKGESVDLQCHWLGDDRRRPALESVSMDFDRALQETLQSWRSWVSGYDSSSFTWAGKWKHLLRRSELCMKLLTHSRSGAILAAPTTSLPEEIGGSRNWDYRFSWLRDGSLTAQAFMAVGHLPEAVDFLCWLEAMAEKGEKSGRFQVLYDPTPRSDVHEQILPHFEGYRGSRPVRIGNEAYKQVQLDIFGEVLDSAFELHRAGQKLNPSLVTFCGRAADQACANLETKDHGIWEVRTEPEHFVHSKLMLWVALDRAIWLAEHYDFGDRSKRWTESRETIRTEILAKGFDPHKNSFRQSYGTDALDAALLRIPLLEFLPFDDPRVQGTIDAVMSELFEDGLVRRYRRADGLQGGEGAFILATFWLVDALAYSGRRDEAERIFDGLANRANHLGLFSEEIDPSSGEFLGNFPQAFSHIGFINSLLSLAHARGEKTPVRAPAGSHRHRHEREFEGVFS